MEHVWVPGRPVWVGQRVPQHHQESVHDFADAVGIVLRSGGPSNARAVLPAIELRSSLLLAVAHIFTPHLPPWLGGWRACLRSHALRHAGATVPIIENFIQNAIAVLRLSLCLLLLLSVNKSEIWNVKA